MNEEDRHRMEFFKTQPGDYDKCFDDYNPAEVTVFYSAISKIFSHKHAQYDANPPANIEEAIVWHFYHKICEGNDVSRGILENGQKLTADAFLSALMSMPQRSDRNLVTFLLGEVGSGKTTLINYLISVKIRPYVMANQLLVFRIDIEDESAENRAPAFWSLVAMLHRKVKHVLQKLPHVRTLTQGISDAFDAIALQTDAGLQSDIKLANEAYNALVTLFSTLRAAGFRILVVLDNIDFVCHLNDEQVFSDFSDTDEVNYILDFCNFIKQLAGNSDIGRLGIHVLVISRHETYQILVETRHTSLLNDFKRRKGNVFTAVRPDEKVIVNAIVGLLEFTSASGVFTSGEKKQILAIKDLLLEDLIAEPEDQLQFIKHMVRITKYGFRDISAFFENYIWRATESDHPGVERGLVKRYLHTYPVGLITYMLGDHVLFQQFKSEFCNIYLVNVQPDRAVNGLSPQHRHSYWLKRMILQLLAAREFEDVESLYDIFHQNGKGYEEVAIRACLNSLGDANCSAMLSYSRKTALHKRTHKEVLQIGRLKVSDRGRHCLDHIFDRFFYLQLVVDDQLLPFPKQLREYFRIPADLDYRYVTAPSRQYFEGAKKMIVNKFTKVLVFLQILEASLESEQLIYADVFSTLETDYGVQPLDIPMVRQNVVSEVRHLNRAFDGTVLDIDRELRNFEGLREKIVKATDHVYATHML